MKQLPLIYLALVGFIFCAVYLVIFGDSGYWVRNGIEKEIAALEGSIKELEQENELLYKKHLLVKKGLYNIKRPQVRTESRNEAIIIKFETGYSDSSREQKRDRPAGALPTELSLTEARVIFIISGLLFCLLGFYFVARFFTGDKIESVASGSRGKTLLNQTSENIESVDFESSKLDEK